MNHQKLKKLIEDSQLTVKRIEEEAGLAPRSIFPILNGQVKNPREATLRGIAKSLGLSYEDFLQQVTGESATTPWNKDLYLQVVMTVAECLISYPAEIVTYEIVKDLVDELYQYSLPSGRVDKGACEMLVRIALRSLKS